MQFTLTCSVGVAEFPADGHDAETLLRHAESAMQRAKQGGRSCFRFHQAQQDADMRARMRLDHAMRQALASQRFRLHYQPQIDLRSGRIVGVSRMSISPGWAGIFAVWVHPDHQRRGIATAMTSSIALVAKENNMAAIFLQVSGDNPGAIAFYERLGFVVHHEYSYLGRTDG